jgi:hypothetical protein
MSGERKGIDRVEVEKVCSFLRVTGWVARKMSTLLAVVVEQLGKDYHQVEGP